MISLPKNNWRVTKYNPVFRDEKGAYLKDEWTSFSDIDKSFNGATLTFEKYLEFEDAYVFTALHFLSDAGLSSLIIKSLEKNKPKIEKANFENISLHLNQLENEMSVSGRTLEIVCRFVLRDLIWCRLESELMFYIHFGWDYYMYIGSDCSSKDAIAFGKSQNLYVEEMISPYLLNKEELK